MTGDPAEKRDHSEPGRMRRLAHEAAEAGANKALHELFSKLGIDVDQQDSINQFRADLVYARKLRRTSEKLTMAALIAIVGALIPGLLTLLWLGLRSRFGVGQP